jgi:hypothetical protein
MADLVREARHALTELEAAAIRRAIGALEQLHWSLLRRLRHTPGVNQVWVAIASRELAVGVADLRRAVECPREG